MGAEPINCLEQLRKYTVIAADTSDFEAIKEIQPTEVTTNPTSILQAIKMEKYNYLLDKASDCAQKNFRSLESQIEAAMDKLFVLFGVEILKLISGRVSTEVDARLSFDVEGQKARARRLIKLYEEEGVSKERVLLKVSSTWEGIQAARSLEKENGIHCNLTLMFSLVQAVACADAGVTVVSPFIGRVTDWYLENTIRKSFPLDEDPGIKYVNKIYNYYKAYGYKTEVMAVSFRSTEHVKRLCGCDIITAHLSLLEKLREENEQIEVQFPFNSENSNIPKMTLDEKSFRWMFNEDAAAVDKLADGIRRFSADARKLEEMIRTRLTSKPEQNSC